MSEFRGVVLTKSKCKIFQSIDDIPERRGNKQRERERESLNKEKGPEDSPSEFKEINTRLSEE